MIAIVDYGMGNLASVAKACRFLGFSARVTSSSSEVRRARALILPGVGAFGPAMGELKRRKLVDPIIESVREGRPFLGLCLGLQLLFDSSEESPDVKGLGLLPGRVRRFQRRAGLKVPHMGWNQIQKVQRIAYSVERIEKPSAIRYPLSAIRCSLLAGVPDGAFMYFVHSFIADPAERGVTVAVTEYGGQFPSVLWNGRNVWATQFHPEKSQRWGLRILKNFLEQGRRLHADHSCN